MLSVVLKLLQHWASRLNVVASVVRCLLGGRCLEFFRFPRGARFVGQRDLYPFAVLLRELHVDEIDSRKGKH
jgi:hypothetical protein